MDIFRCAKMIRSYTGKRVSPADVLAAIESGAVDVPPNEDGEIVHIPSGHMQAFYGYFLHGVRQAPTRDEIWRHAAAIREANPREPEPVPAVLQCYHAAHGVNPRQNPRLRSLFDPTNHPQHY